DEGPHRNVLLRRPVYNLRMSDRPRVYSEQEASEIVKRAAELAEAKAANTYKSGITKAELERIAAEMGVPLEALDQAIRES
ncbi:hypothetical protein ABTN75_21235, partial [Acinetobacter baumannii]